MVKDEQYYNDLDKRTKEYKEWVLSQNIEPHVTTDNKIKGLGDVVEAITEATGIKALVKFIAGEDCGCDERKKKLNEMFNFTKKPNCLTEDEYSYLSAFFESNPNKVLPSQQMELNKIYSRVFNLRAEMTGCAGCVRDMVSKLKQVHEVYELEK